MKSKLLWVFLNVVCTAAVAIALQLMLMTASVYNAIIVLVTVIAMALIKWLLSRRIGNTYDIVDGGIVLAFGVIIGIVSIFTYIDWCYISMMFMISGGGDLVKGLWDRGWGYQALAAAVMIIVATPIPFFVSLSAPVEREAVPGDYSAHAVCCECGAPADGGVFRLAFVDAEYYCNACFEHKEEWIAGYPDCEVEGCDNAKVSEELTFCKDHASKCEDCDTYIYPGHRWCDACTAKKIDAVS